MKGPSSDDSDSPVTVSESPTHDPKGSPRNVGPISMDEAYRGSGSDHSFREIIKSFPKGTGIRSSLLWGSDKSKGRKVENMYDSAVGLGGYLSSNDNDKRENDDGDSDDAGLLRGGGDNYMMAENFGEVKGGCKQENYFDSMVGVNENFALNQNIRRENDDKALHSPILEVENIAKKEELDRVEGGKVENLRDLNRNESEKLPLGLDIKCEGDDEALVDLNCLTMNEKNIARVVPGRIMSIKFFPTPNMRMITVGNKLGNVGFWNMGSREDDNGIFFYHTHPGPVSGISIPQFNLSKVILRL